MQGGICTFELWVMSSTGGSRRSLLSLILRQFPSDGSRVIRLILGALQLGYRCHEAAAIRNGALAVPTCHPLKDYEFHVAIWDLGGNALLNEVLKRISTPAESPDIQQAQAPLAGPAAQVLMRPSRYIEE